MEREFDRSIANQRVRELEEEKRKEVEKRKRQDERNASGGNTGAGLLAVRKEYPSEFHDKTDQEAYPILQRWKRVLEQ